MGQGQNTTVLKDEIANFAKDSSHWWNEDGPFKPLHRLNPVRLSYIRDQIISHLGRNDDDLKALKGLDILDVGCGGGLVTEPLCRMGASVTGIDADENAIAVANEHAADHGLKISYHAKSTENLLRSSKKKYDVVTALEIIEHVDNPDVFVQHCADLCKPGGLIIFSTLNRTPKSFALGIVAAEYVLGWVPKGTHNWKKFIKPSELIHFGHKAVLKERDVCGLIFNPLKNEFALHKRDIDVNYLLTMEK